MAFIVAFPLVLTRLETRNFSLDISLSKVALVSDFIVSEYKRNRLGVFVSLIPLSIEEATPEHEFLGAIPSSDNHPISFSCFVWID